MKTRIKLLLLLAAAAAGGILYSAPRKGSRIIIPRELTSVRLSLVGAPRIGHDQQGSEKSSPYKWLQVRIGYRFNPSLRFKPYFTYDDMRVEVYMRVTPSNGTWRGLRWFSGTQYLYKVIPDGRNKTLHYVSLFMPPALIHNYAKRNENSLLKDCEGVVLFYNKDRLLGRTFFSGTTTSARQLEKMAPKLLAEFKLMQNNPRLMVKDGLWPREMTPWHHLDADRFDLPRPVFNAGAPGQGFVKAPTEENEEEEEKKAEKEKKTDEKKNSAGEVRKEEQEMKFTRSSGSKKRKSRGRR